MSKLTTKQRKALPKSDFALGTKYPIPDKNHAVNAKSRASQMYNEGKISASGKAKVFAKANAKLGNK